MEVEGVRTSDLEIKCGDLQCSNLWSLLFLVYVNDLYGSSRILEPIMFGVDKTGFF